MQQLCSAVLHELFARLVSLSNLCVSVLMSAEQKNHRGTETLRWSEKNSGPYSISLQPAFQNRVADDVNAAFHVQFLHCFGFMYLDRSDADFESRGDLFV